jgi:HlyD family secretion protein
MRMWVAALVLIILGASSAGWYWHHAEKPAIEYRTAVVRRGDLVSSISATGTLEPVEVVDIGAQVAGQIQEFGKDANGKPVDYRSPVEPGMLLAKIDDTVYKAAVDVARAQLEQAKMLISKGDADLQEAQAKLLQAQHNWDRARTLGPSDALSQNDYDMYQADYATAVANVAIAQNEVAQAKSGVPLAQAQLDSAQRSEDFCTITSPLKGVILDRRVNIGQTVVSNMSTPSLFLIARDLSRMQIWVSVNEADVGKIIPGAPVTFTTDAFPGQTFKAKVGKVRWNPTMSQNVVLYTVEVEVDNSDSVLIPYLTAKVQFEVARESNILIVPNLALRWTPATPAQVSPDARAAWQQNDGVDSDPEKSHHGTLWIKDGGFVRPVEVKLGVTDRIDTAVKAVSSDDLSENAEVITGGLDPSGLAGEVNPFLPPVHHHGQ